MKISLSEKNKTAIPSRIGFYGKRLVYYAVLFSLVIQLSLPAMLYPVNLDFSGAREIKVSWGGALERVIITVFGIKAAQAIDAQDIFEPDAVKVSDKMTHINTQETNVLLPSISAKESAEKKAELLLKDAVFGAMKQSFSYMLNTMAFDVASWLASGGEGQQPMFYTEGWGDYLQNVADNAAGLFIEDLSGSWLGFNVCDPSSPQLKINIGLGLEEKERPKTPDCSVTKMVSNYRNLLNSANALDLVRLNFDPNKNDIGIALSIFGQYYEKKTKAVTAATKDRESGGGFKAVMSKISNFIKTPESIVKARAENLSEDAKLAEWSKVQHGAILQDAIGVFVSTLAGKLFERLFKEGLAALSGSPEDEDSKNYSPFKLNLTRRENSDLYTGETGVQGFAGINTAENRFFNFLQAGIKNEGPYDVLSKLSFCPDAQNPGPDECAIRPEFRTAIERELTLREAIEQKLVDGGAPFGFKEYDGGAIYRGLPWRSILLLRAFRVVPAAWEVAAGIINETEGGKVFSLNDLISVYHDSSSKYYHLIDQNWVLKMPDHYCKVEGFGPKLVSDSVNGETRVISRASYCADYQSCLEEKADGSCRYYGYCTEEKRVWKFDGATECFDYYNTCLSFQAPGGANVSYLQNSLDFNGCNANNAGCRWYCADFNAVDNIWDCAYPKEEVLKPCAEPGGCKLSADCLIAKGQSNCFNEASQVNLNLDRPCDESSQWWEASSDQCHLRTECTVPLGGVSCVQSGCDHLTDLLPNSDFEKGAVTPGNLADQWYGFTDYFRRVSGASELKVSGKFSLRFYNVGGAIPAGQNAFSSEQITGLNPAKTYTASAWVYNKLNTGHIEILTDTASRRASNDIKNGWQQVSFDFSPLSAGKITVLGAVSPDAVGTVWFDSFRVTESCLAAPVRLSLIGTVAKDGSKLHLNRQSAECSADAAGCSQFIQTLAGAGTNLFVNSSFEFAAENDPKVVRGWAGSNDAAGTTVAERVDTNNGRVLSGNYAAKVTLNATTDRYFQTAAPFTLNAGRNYVFSAWIYVDCPTCTTQNVYLDFGTNEPQSPPAANSRGTINQWQRIYLATSTAETLPVNPRLVLDWNLSNIASIYVDDVMLEETAYNNIYPSDYNDYGQANLLYLKQAPESLGCQGYTVNRPGPLMAGVTEDKCAGENLVWRQDGCHRIDRPECASYAPYCEADEVGCQLYTPAGGRGTDAPVPAVVAFDDYCPAECVGYDSYYQSKTFLERQEALEYFIPRTAKMCSAAAAGCDEFTNLDEAAKGGEAREYYQYLRLCKKPGEGDANCHNYYSWLGSDETGYQLKAYTFSADAAGAPRPAINHDGAGNWPDLPDSWCADKNTNAAAAGTGNEDQPNCCNSADDLANNPFCREYYAVNGAIYYRLYPNTISCSENCHPYRKTRLGNNDTLDANNCATSFGTWVNGACVYQVIPGEGIGCSAAAAGCREYRGNASGNVFEAYADNFEDGDYNGWKSGEISSEALNVGGHSLKSIFVSPNYAVTSMLGQLSGICNTRPTCSNTTEIDCRDEVSGLCRGEDVTTHEICVVAADQKYCSPIANVLKSGRTYLIQFSAKTAAKNTTLRLQLLSTTLAGVTAAVNPDLGAAAVNSEWGYYTVGPFTLNQTNPSLQLRFIGEDLGAADAGKAFFIDNLSFKEVQNYVYAIKNSWQTPLACDTNPFLNPAAAAPRFMLGCKQYVDGRGTTHNLKSFNHLCREEAAGCEALIDTANSASPYEQKFNTGDTAAGADYSVTVAADQTVYLVNQPAYQCNSAAKGCQALGLPAVDYTPLEPRVGGYETVYKINDPDKYEQILCQNSEVGCDEFGTGAGYAYFKDPLGRTCERRLIGGTENAYGWFKTGTTATTTPDCPLVEPPVGVNHPGNGYAGLCPGQFNTCSLFIDSPSDIGKNLVFNSNLNLEGTATTPYGWDWSGSEKSLTQEVILTAGKIYTLSFVSKEKLTPALDNKLYIQLRDCTDITSYDDSLIKFKDSGKDYFIIPQQNYTHDDRVIAGLSDQRQYSGRFKLDYSASCNLALVYKGGNISQLLSKINAVTIKETGLYYNLENSVNKLVCNGVVNEEQGCVLFNDRSDIAYSRGESDTTYLKFDANASGNNELGQAINNGLAVTACQGVCDASEVIKVKPDRACQSWLYPSSLGTFKDSHGAEKAFSLNLGLCDSMDENGQCDNSLILNGFNVLTGQEERLDRFGDAANPGDPEEIKNLSGYYQAGLRNDDKHFNVAGYYPYAEMTQDGGTAIITNGSFEKLFGATAQPLGWNASGGWDVFKFQTLTDGKKSVEGYGYLQLNTFYQAASEDVDLEKGQAYVVSGWINTLSLQHPNDIAHTYGEIELDGVDCADKLKIKAGQNWQHVTCQFSAPSNKTKIRLQNEAPDITTGDCPGDGETKHCYISGFTLFDEITIKPVLSVRQSAVANISDFIPRSCRVYPTAEALACNVDDGVNILNGQNGYCLLLDPANPKQCLQWWPVDQIKGDETQDVVGGYQDRAPLYYCTEKKQEKVEVGATGALARITEQASGTEYAGFQDLDSGNQINTIPFIVDAQYRIFFRQPFVKQVTFKGGFVGGGASSSFGGGIITAKMEHDAGCVFVAGAVMSGSKFAGPVIGGGCLVTGLDPDSIDFCSPTWTPGCNVATAIAKFLANFNQIKNYLANLFNFDKQCSSSGDACQSDADCESSETCEADPGQLTTNTSADVWGGWGLECIGLPSFGVLCLPLPWHVVNRSQDTTASLFGGILGEAKDIFGDSFDLLQAMTLGMKIVTDQDTQYAGEFVDPYPDIPGDILGAVWFNSSTQDKDVYATGIFGKFETEFYAPYCSQLAEVVTSAGGNKAWNNRVFAGSGFVQNEILPLDYHVLGDKWENRPVKYFYEKIFDWDDFLATALDDYDYVASDYRPFGGAVQPESGQYPEKWDSRTEVADKQPLFFEWPRTEAFEAPYQARAGQLHNPADLQHLFLKTNSVWNWSNQGTPKTVDDGYVQDNASGAGWDRLADWDADETASYCGSTGDSRPPRTNPPTDAEICRVRPKILNIRLNEEADGTNQAKWAKVHRTGTVKLSFNVKVDPDQLPIRAYDIDWGDGTHTDISGATLLDRPNPDNQFVFYHSYDYWHLRKLPGVTCEEDKCEVMIKIKVKDNWNAYSCAKQPGDASCFGSEENKYYSMTGKIIVHKQ